MKIVSAYLVVSPTEEEKKQLSFVNAVYSSVHKGWFISQEQKDKLDKPEDIPKPTLPSGTYIDDEVDEWAIHGGNTYKKKEDLKKFGATWKPSLKKWVIPKANVSYDTLAALLS